MNGTEGMNKYMGKYLFTTLCIVLFLNINNQLVGQGRYSPRLSELYERTDLHRAGSEKERPVRIGVSASRLKNGGSSVPGTYIQAIRKAGGVPVIIPVMTDIPALETVVELLDGLVMIGGEDFDPSYYGEAPIAPGINVIDSLRDIYDLALVKLATDRNIPLLGICRGAQAINVAFGGTLYQDIPLQHEDKSVAHRQSKPAAEGTHLVKIKEGSELFSILGMTEIMTNSFHHQAIKDVAPHFKVVAQTADGIVEAIEAYPDRPIMAVQWHPEGHVAGGDATMLKIFTHMIRQAELFRKARDLHQRIFTIDTHCDTPLEITRKGINIGKREKNQVNIPKMREGMLDAAFFAVYTAQGPRDRNSSENNVRKVDAMIDAIYEQAELNKDVCAVAVTSQDLARLKKEGKKAIFIGIENGYGIGKDLSNIAYFKNRGVNYMTLCHTKDNDICDTSSDTKNEWNGLSPFGRKVVREMNRLGMLIDISHAGEKTFWDVIERSTQPIFASHSSVRALCDHDRNLTDEQLRAIAKNEGVVQICLADLFIHPDRTKAGISDVIEHIGHVVRVAGIDYVGIGSDFDGGGGVKGCNSSGDMLHITVKLLEKGYTEEDIAKIWGGNFLRVLSRVQESAQG